MSQSATERSAFEGDEPTDCRVCFHPHATNDALRLTLGCFIFERSWLCVTELPEDLGMNPFRLSADAAFFELAGEIDAVLGPGLGFQARLGNRLAGAFADAVGAVEDLGQCHVD